MQKIYFLLLFLLFTACANYHTAATISVENGRHTIVCAAQNISICYYGDYILHDLNPQKTLFWNPNFVKTLSIKTAKSKFLYATHTTVPPYISSIGFFYKNQSLAQITAVTTACMKQQNARNFNISTVEISGVAYTKLSYSVPNPALKINETYFDYFTKTEANVLRVTFSFLENGDEKTISEESQNILSNLKKKP